uniref:Uncharacterized protein n=1 Tax=Siphoviridae sp. ctE6L85 TaxID=2826202 RepID=A0A8S5QQ42_9CAUD|nr:MAG TPA: hypothetical protein [Siphoviridae sp. ctE6L85]
MFPVSVYQSIMCGYGLCAASATPSVVQRHLTAISFTPGHNMCATLDSDRHSQP